MPPRPEAAEDDRRTTYARPSVPAQRARPPRSAVSRVTMRRRRVLAVLLFATLVTAATVPLTAVPWWGPLIALAVTLAYLVHCRLQARTRRDVSRTRDAVRKRSRSRLLRFDAIERLMTVRRELAEERAAEEQRWLEAEQADERLREAEEKRAAEAAAGWQPVPVPLPTYVSKPMAPRRVTVDLTRPGAWSEAHADSSGTHSTPDSQVPEQSEPREAASGRAPMSALLEDAADAEDQLDAIIAPRAVND
jgi:hypothetical protein